ncbi:MAG TPA: hypothetical protein VLX92_34620 [Kofleriaceae bacterium]|nr:hypothetical protein [Kofleriaceae bacterium]
MSGDKTAAILALALAACGAAAAPRASCPRRLGDAMDEAGRRFNRAERAVLAGRWELASYDLAELAEVFTDDLADSSWNGRPQLARLAQQFSTMQVAALRDAARARDRQSFEHAVSDAAHACNECHKAADQAYIQISDRLGADAPVVGQP